jgi:drug/metabolite transporter (DMT)-like permease
VSLSSLALGLLMVGAVLHAIWNVLLKLADEKYLAMWWALALGSLGFLPFLIVTPPLPPGMWPYIVASAIFEAAYFAILIAAYERADFSVVYPIARGAAPGLLALWAVLFLHERLSFAGVAGLLVLVLGLMITGSSALWQSGRWSPDPVSIGLALAVAFCISAYSVIDGAAVQVAHPVPYTTATFALTTALLAPLIFRRYGLRATLAAWRGNWPKITVIGFCMPGSYMLALAAYTLAPVSYAGAIREMSIVFAALIGWLWLREGLGLFRIVGAAVIFCGVLIIARAG